MSKICKAYRDGIELSKLTLEAFDPSLFNSNLKWGMDAYYDREQELYKQIENIRSTVKNWGILRRIVFFIGEEFDGYELKG